MQLARHLTSMALAAIVASPPADGVWVLQFDPPAASSGYAPGGARDAGFPNRLAAARSTSPATASTHGRPVVGATSSSDVSSPGAPCLTVSPGFVVTSGGDGVGGIELSAWTADGALAGVTVSAPGGSFDLVTLAGEPLLLSVAGLATSVPFVPGEMLAIVVP